MDIDVNEAASPAGGGAGGDYSDRLMVPRCDSASGGGTSFTRRRKLSTAGKVRARETDATIQ